MKQFYVVLFLFISIISFSQEICDNGIDDDGDGLIDLNDTDCLCRTSSITSIIPNPSFEDYDNCPTGISQLHKASTWEQATIPTTDYFNSCGYINNAQMTPFPEGNAATGAFFVEDWQEYLGACLNNPMLAGTHYQLTFNIASKPADGSVNLANGGAINYGPIDLVLYGKETCTGFPILTTGCPSAWDSSWIILGSVNYTPLGNWGTLTIMFTPSININTIILGSPCSLPPEYKWINNAAPFFYFDNLLLNTSESFGVNISQTGNFCDNNLVLNANLTTTLTTPPSYQWYKDGIAIIGATNSYYDVPSYSANLGVYSVKIITNTSCYISQKITINNTISGPTYTTIQPNCFTPTGSITITTPASEYSFDNGLTWQSSPTKQNLSNSIYYIKIKTPNGCISSLTSVSISPPQLLQGSNISVTQPTTCEETGTITVSSIYASEYSYDNGITWTSSDTASNLTPGNYLVKIKDALGCESSSLNVFINRIYLDLPSFTVIQPSCDENGTITITTIADLYSFDDGVTWTTNNSVTNLNSGVYIIKIKNNNDCESNSHYVYLNKFYLNVTPTYTVINASCGTNGSIIITSPANEYSFNNGDTWTTDNIATDLTPGYYYIQIRNNPNCISYSQSVYIDTYYLENPTYSLIQPSCYDGGTIKIDTVADFYSFNGGTTWTTDPVATNLPAGSYPIMIKDNLGCTSRVQYAYLNFYYLENPLYNITNSTCSNNGSIEITSFANEYSFDGGSTWTTNPVATNLSPGYYIIKIRNSPTCQSNYTYVNLRDFNSIYPEYTYTNPGCDTYGTITITTPADLYSFNGGLTWTTNPITTNLLGGQTYNIKAKTNTGCETNTNSVYMNSIYLTLPNVNDFNVTTCDNLNDGSENINLTLYNNDLISDASNFTFKYYKTDLGALNQIISDQITNSISHNLSNTNNTVYVRVTSLQNCSNVAKLTFNFIDSPYITMANDSILCENSTVTINAENGFDSYLWSTGETTQSIVISEAGNYTLTVTEEHGPLTCSSTKNINVILSNPAAIIPFNTEDWTVNNNIILVNVEGLGDYEYSLDGINYQESPIFSDLENGEYTIYVNDKNGCGESIGKTFLLMYPKFFTPNGDGYNDFWKIKFSENEPNMSIKIFDRHGKFIKQLSPNSQGWDGTYLGQQAFSTDYWFTVTRQNGKEYKGHFSLKR